jgi:hypothetical protein
MVLVALVLVELDLVTFAYDVARPRSSSHALCGLSILWAP